MAEGYCVKCKAKKEIANGVEETMKNGRKAIKGKCPTCGTVMFKILGGKAAPGSANPNPTGRDELIMSQQLAYVIITPYSLYKSRTGGILSRLISRTGLDLAAARMFAPSAELARQYAETIVSAHDPQDRKIQELLQQYVLQNFSPDPKTGRRRRVMMLLVPGRRSGAQGPLGGRQSRSGPPRRRNHPRHLRRLDHGRQRAGPLLRAGGAGRAQRGGSRGQTQIVGAVFRQRRRRAGKCHRLSSPARAAERTLVLIKPDNFRFPTGRPGNVIDFFSRTGLFIVGIKVHRMSVAQAMEFYGPVREVLRTKLKDVVGAKAKAALEKEFGFKIAAAEEKAAWRSPRPDLRRQSV